jgi:hypothetical protein
VFHMVVQVPHDLVVHKAEQDLQVRLVLQALKEQ